jgi:hypothetical protein
MRQNLKQFHRLFVTIQVTIIQETTVIDFGGAGQHVILPAENLIGNLQW